LRLLATEEESQLFFTEDDDTTICTLNSGVCGTSVSITGKHFCRFRPNQLFTDEIVNTYFWLLADRDKQIHVALEKMGIKHSKGRVVVYNSFFMLKLMGENLDT